MGKVEYILEYLNRKTYFLLLLFIFLHPLISEVTEVIDNSISKYFIIVGMDNIEVHKYQGTFKDNPIVGYITKGEKLTIKGVSNYLYKKGGSNVNNDQVFQYYHIIDSKIDGWISSQDGIIIAGNKTDVNQMVGYYTHIGYGIMILPVYDTDKLVLRVELLTKTESKEDVIHFLEFEKPNDIFSQAILSEIPIYKTPIGFLWDSTVGKYSCIRYNDKRYMQDLFSDFGKIETRFYISLRSEVNKSIPEFWYYFRIRNIFEIKRILENNPIMFDKSFFWNENPLFTAMRDRDLEMIGVLIKNGVYQTEYTGNEFDCISLIYKAIKNNDIQLLEVLLKNGAKFDDSVDGTQYISDLQFAIDMNNFKAAELLVKYGYDVNKIFQYGPTHNSSSDNIGTYTLLSSMISLNKKDWVDFLVKSNANVNQLIVNLSGLETGLKIFTSKNMLELTTDYGIINLLEDYGYKYNEKFTVDDYRKQIALIYASISDNRVRIRSAPNLNGTILGLLQNEQVISVLDVTKKEDTVNGINNFWYNVRTEDGLQGWVFGQYVAFGY